MKKDPTEQMIEPWKSKKILKTRFEIRPRASFKVIKIFQRSFVNLCRLKMIQKCFMTLILDARSNLSKFANGSMNQTGLVRLVLEPFPDANFSKSGRVLSERDRYYKLICVTECYEKLHQQFDAGFWQTKQFLHHDKL